MENERKMITAKLTRGPSKMGWTAWFLTDREGRVLNTEPVCSTPEDKWHRWFIRILESLTTPYWGLKESPADELVHATPPSPLTAEQAKVVATKIDDLFDHALQGGRLYAEGFNRAVVRDRIASELIAVATTGETGSVRFAVDFTVKSKEPLSESLTFLALRNIGRSDFVLYCYEPETGNYDAVAAPVRHSEIVGAAMDYMVNDEDYSREELFVDLAVTTEKESS